MHLNKKNHILKSLNAWRHCEWWLKQQSVGLHLFGKQWRHTNFPTIHRSPLHVLLLFLPLQHSAAKRKCCLRPLHVVQRDKNLSKFLFHSLCLNDLKISFSYIFDVKFISWLEKNIYPHATSLRFWLYCANARNYWKRPN